MKKLIYLSSWLGGKDNASLIFLPKESISLLQNLLNEETTGCFVEVWDCFSSRQILLPNLPKKRPSKKSPKTATIDTKEIGDKDLSISSKSRENRNIEKHELNIEIGKK